jgi:hypothetical protein
MACDATSDVMLSAVSGLTSSSSGEMSLSLRYTPPMSASRGLAAPNTIVLAPCCGVFLPPRRIDDRIAGLVDQTHRAKCLLSGRTVQCGAHDDARMRDIAAAWGSHPSTRSRYNHQERAEKERLLRDRVRKVFMSAVSRELPNAVRKVQRLPAASLTISREKSANLVLTP